MAEPSRREVEEYLVAEFNWLAAQRLTTNVVAMATAQRGAQVIFAASLFFMRTGLRHREEPYKFKAFLKQMDEAAAALN